MDPYSIIIKPHLTEKSMNAIDQKNELTFVIRRTANRGQVKNAIQEMYEVKVERVNTQITSRGVKLAYVKLSEEDSAEDIAMKMGVF
ncbi:MAG TPA: 50S ribosomal protein L23 [Methanobacteriaceae archaeon]|nr:50S ribosomal protein L23 [Methanobacteriaceae archaeon]